MTDTAPEAEVEAEPAEQPEAIAGVDSSTAAIPPNGAEVEAEAEVEPAEQHPEPVAFATVRQDNVSEPGMQHTHSLGVDENGDPAMVKSSHGEAVTADE